MSDNTIYTFVSLVLLFLVGMGLAWVMRYRFLQDKNGRGFGDSFDLQKALGNAPSVIWAERNQEVIWQNERFDELFDGVDLRGIRAFDTHADKPTGRTRLKSGHPKGGAWFSLETSKQDGIDYYYAADAAPLIESEQELQRFIQTLTETFAHLPIGLAIFDKKRDLSLFNPALSGLLDLPAEWLIRRPSLMSFLDRLRNEGIMPEPSDFQSIRQEFKNLESGAINGTYQAEWTLGNGRIYRVVGRPHVQGGLALLFEDISKSVMIERQFRGELEQLYSALDCLADGVAIFDPAGELVFVNDAFDEIWGCDLAGAVSPVTVVDFSRLLQDMCKPSPAWGDFRQFVLDPSERSQWQADVFLGSGGVVNMTFSPIAGGQVFCEFRFAHRRNALDIQVLQDSA